MELIVPLKCQRCQIPTAGLVRTPDHGWLCKECVTCKRIDDLEQRCARMEETIAILLDKLHIASSSPNTTIVIPRREGDNIARIT